MRLYSRTSRLSSLIAIPSQESGASQVEQQDKLHDASVRTIGKCVVGGACWVFLILVLNAVFRVEHCDAQSQTCRIRDLYTDSILVVETAMLPDCCLIMIRAVITCRLWLGVIPMCANPRCAGVSTADRRSQSIHRRDGHDVRLGAKAQSRASPHSFINYHCYKPTAPSSLPMHTCSSDEVGPFSQ